MSKYLSYMIFEPAVTGTLTLDLGVRDQLSGNFYLTQSNLWITLHCLSSGDSTDRYRYRYYQRIIGNVDIVVNMYLSLVTGADRFSGLEGDCLCGTMTLRRYIKDIHPIYCFFYSRVTMNSHIHSSIY